MKNKITKVAAGYSELLRSLKERIRSAQVKVALSVNSELVLLYWQIGREILTRQAAERWGSKVIDRLAVDLRREFPEMQGFSTRNLKYMRAFAESWPDEQFVQAVLAQIAWYHNITLIDKVKNLAEREWYIIKTIEHGWEVDHIKPVAKGDSDELNNLQPLQWENNRKKGDNSQWACK